MLALAQALPVPGPVPTGGETLRLFDGLAPFFAGHEGGGGPDGAINWSKIPFAALERDGLLDDARAAAVLAEFDRYVAAMAGLGYNAVALDDLAHLVPHDFYAAPLRARLRSYRRLYAHAFATVKAHGLSLFVVTDYMFFNPAIEAHLAETGRAPADLFVATVETAFATYPQIDGLILRIGEGDGVDVRGDFASRLTVRRPREANELLRRLLPLFEAGGRTLVFRTWTLGAYPVGDLIWNRRTYDAVLAGIDSPSLVVSLKYGDADFFRYLGLNPLFFHGPHKKLIELQCRREYEGMGEYPSFVGWLYAAYLAALRERPNNVVGLFALQAGGWAPFSRLAFCAGGSLWNELNAEVTVALFAGETTVEATVAAFCARRGIADVDGFLRLLALSERAIEEGLYVREFAARPRYFRRVRVPPLLWVFWHNVTAGGLVADVSRCLVRDPAAAVAEGRRAVETVREMAALAQDLGLRDEGFGFQLATFEILAGLREVLLGLDTAATRARLADLLADYRARYPRGYRFDDPPEARATGRALALLLPLLVRDRTRYRRADRLLLHGGVARLRGLANGRLGPSLPRFVDRQGMSSDVLLR